MKEVTAIRIDAYLNRIEEIKIDGNDFNDINAAINCDIFCIGAHLHTGDVLFVDDMGWLDPRVKRAFKMGGVNTILPKDALFAGNGLIVGHNYGGETIDAKSKLLDVANAVEFMPLSWEISDEMRKLAASATKVIMTRMS